MSALPRSFKEAAMPNRPSATPSSALRTKGSGFLLAARRAKPSLAIGVMALYRADRGRNRVTGRGAAGGNGAHPAILRAKSLASALPVTAGNRRRSSTAAENSPPFSNAARIAAA